MLLSGGLICTLGLTHDGDLCFFFRFSFSSLQDYLFFVQPLAVLLSRLRPMLLHPRSITGVRGAAGGTQPAAAKPPCIIVWI